MSLENYKHNLAVVEKANKGFIAGLPDPEKVKLLDLHNRKFPGWKDFLASEFDPVEAGRITDTVGNICRLHQKKDEFGNIIMPQPVETLVQARVLTVSTLICIPGINFQKAELILSLVKVAEDHY